MNVISRQAAIEAPERSKDKTAKGDIGGFYNTIIQNNIEKIEALPPAQQWIPVSERLPKNDDWVIVTILDERGDTPFKYTDFGWYLEEANCWVIGAEQRKDVTAWMPLPGPYKEDKNDADVC